MNLDKRRHPRWQVRNRLVGRIAPNHKASLLDISLGGALIEHPNLVRPETVLVLTVYILKREISLRCRVVRSLVYRYAHWPSGEQDMLYRTGLEFLALSETSHKIIDEYIGSLKESPPARGRTETKKKLHAKTQGQARKKKN